MQFSTTLRPPILSRHYARLEPLAQAHAEGLLEQAQEPDLWRYMGTGNLSDPERLRAWIKTMQEEPEQGIGMTFAIVSCLDGKVAGSTSLFDLSRTHHTGEIGRTWLGANYRRTGINTECKYLLLQYSFETLQLNRVQIKTDSRNLRSRQAIERIGATFEGILRSHMVLWDGYIRDTAMYSVIASEWPVVKAHLEGLMLRSAR